MQVLFFTISVLVFAHAQIHQVSLSPGYNDSSCNKKSPLLKNNITGSLLRNASGLLFHLWRFHFLFNTKITFA
jgi:hypothetical protein